MLARHLLWAETALEERLRSLLLSGTPCIPPRVPIGQVGAEAHGLGTARMATCRLLLAAPVWRALRAYWLRPRLRLDLLQPAENRRARQFANCLRSTGRDNGQLPEAASAHASAATYTEL